MARHIRRIRHLHWQSEFPVSLLFGWHIRPRWSRKWQFQPPRNKWQDMHHYRPWSAQCPDPLTGQRMGLMVLQKRACWLNITTLDQSDGEPPKDPSIRPILLWWGNHIDAAEWGLSLINHCPPPVTWWQGRSCRPDRPLDAMSKVAQCPPSPHFKGSFYKHVHKAWPSSVWCPMNRCRNCSAKRI